ncbi:MAG: mercury methylation corrinoid protein HgcA [Planctomycetota bacterium]
MPSKSARRTCACCASPPPFADGINCQTGAIATPAGEVPRVSTELFFEDRLGSCKARLGIGRMDYAVAPGLYAVGDPTSESPVFVTANYKMSFDRLRSQLGGRDGWIMVLNTKGINVWCAAGKGAFGTEEILRRIEAVRLPDVVAHRQLILPQLGAPGVAAHEVKKRSGFRVIYGPVRAEDLPAFMDAGMKATPAMRRVRFGFWDRVVLIPIELVVWVKYAALIAVAMLVLSGLGRDFYSLSRLLSVGARSAILFLGAYLAGVALAPALLPWLPGRAFSVKGAAAGFLLVLFLGILSLAGVNLSENPLSAIAWVVIIPTVASFLGMNFTGASTYTSLSGVLREMRLAVPIQIACAAIGGVLWLVARFV